MLAEIQRPIPHVFSLKMCSEHNYLGIENLAEVICRGLGVFLFLITTVVCAKAKMW